ncbi:MAG: 4-(cytidine 5'-diphospho)-2-C-methyl-D-erythritol kinase, partial [Clostridia bacterium]|nr:4-(cytidine 5'-diphospho)-2-C-methyl-D-erythritol kinase [Clostridia bacterium]
MKITVKAYAKINLMLDILSTLPNGYHDLFMIMQSVGIYDRVTVEKTDSKGIEITCTKEGVPTDEKNIVHKAATKFFADTSTENTGI